MTRRRKKLVMFATRRSDRVRDDAYDSDGCGFGRPVQLAGLAVDTGQGCVVESNAGLSFRVEFIWAGGDNSGYEVIRGGSGAVFDDIGSSPENCQSTAAVRELVWTPEALEPQAWEPIKTAGVVNGRLALGPSDSRLQMELC